MLRCLSSSTTGQEFLQYHADQLRNEAPVGRKVMLIWDKACIDYRHWFKLKHTYGIYLVTLEKSNSAAEVCSGNRVDHGDPRNQGLVSDHLVGTSTGVMLRRIVYTNPEDGVTYTYFSSEFNLPAYQIVLRHIHTIRSDWCCRQLYQYCAPQSHSVDPAIHPVGSCLDLQTDSLE